MIGILGTKRILILAVLFAMNVALGLTVYLFLMPQRTSKELDLTNLTSQISTLQSDIGRMQLEMEQLTAQQGQFDILKNSGFFNNQGREQAEKIFKTLQNLAGVASATANIMPGTAEDNEDAQKAEYKLLRSPVKIHIEAIDPTDIYRYISLLEKGFPGHLAIQNIDLQRREDVSNDILQRIARGENPVLVQADVEMMWHTMVPKSQVIEPSVSTMPGR